MNPKVDELLGAGLDDLFVYLVGAGVLVLTDLVAVGAELVGIENELPPVSLPVTEPDDFELDVDVFLYDIEFFRMAICLSY